MPFQVSRILLIAKVPLWQTQQLKRVLQTAVCLSIHFVIFTSSFDPCLGCLVRTAWFYHSFLLSVSWGRSWCILKHVLDQFHFLDWLLHNCIHNLQRFSGIPSSLSIRVTPACATACTQARSGIIPPPCWTLCKVFFSSNAALFFSPNIFLAYFTGLRITSDHPSVQTQFTNQPSVWIATCTQAHTCAQRHITEVHH